MDYRRSKGILLHLTYVFVLLTLVACAEAQRRGSPQARGQSPARGQRIAPPDRVACPRNNLTSYNGRILTFHRTTGRTVIRVRTDWETTERVVLRHPGSDDPSEWFLLEGEPFEQSDWALIERSRNRLRPRMRANVWVCDDGRNPIVDWQPPKTDQHSQPGKVTD